MQIYRHGSRSKSSGAKHALLHLAAVAAFLTTIQCTKDGAKNPPDEAVKTNVPATPSPAAVNAGSPDESGKTAAATTPEPAAKAPPAAPPVSTNCAVLPKIVGDPPVYLPGKGVVITRLMKACTTPSGQSGFEKDTPWLAMGFPCTGGAGRIDIKGHYGNPKMVSFIVGTDCMMNPAEKAAVKTAAEQGIGLPSTAKLMAFTPFVVQYWEVPGLTDADTGFSIDLRSAPALEGAWNRFQKKDPLHVRLFGRENAWVQGGFFYMVEADLKMSGRTQFQLDVTSVKKLTPADLAGVKARCEQLKPQRNCADVF